MTANPAGFPGMEHNRGGVPIIPEGTDAPRPMVDRPTRQDRYDAMRFAVDLIRQQDGFNSPGATVLAIAPSLARYLHNGKTPKDDQQ